jgi:predicted secreted acid phosphatase
MAIIAIDLDECVVDNSARAARTIKPDGKIDWNVMFVADLILELDQPMPEQLARLREFAHKGYEIWYITSRQAAKCQVATVQWLEREGYPFPQNVICRLAFKKTVVFKAEAVQKLHAGERGPVVLFADNSTANLEAVAALNIPGLRVSDTLVGVVEDLT